MALLETFLTLFETNAKEAEADMAKAEAGADALADAMAKVGAADLEKAGASAKALKEEADKAAAALGEATTVDTSGIAAAVAETKKLETAAENAADAVSRGLQLDTEPLARAKSLQDQILDTAHEIAEAERNINQYLLGNENLNERTLDLIGGQAGLAKRVEAETRQIAQVMVQSAKAAGNMEEELRDGVKQADKLGDELKDAGGQAMGLVRNVAAGIATLVSVGALVGGVMGQIDKVTELIERASRARIDVAAYDQWRRAIVAAGGSAQEAESQFDALGERMMEAFGDAESEAAKALKEMGVSSKTLAGEIKPTEVALLDLAASMDGVSKEVAVNNLRRLGIVDPTMVNLILQGRDALQATLDVQKANGALTLEQANRLKTLRTALNTAKDGWDGFKNTMLSGVAPALGGVFEMLTKATTWLSQNKDVAIGFGISLAAALGVAAAVAVGTFAPAMFTAALATLAATWPIVAIAAAVLAVGAAFTLAYDDVKAFLNGQPSLLGELVNKYTWVRDAVEWIGKAFAALRIASGVALVFLRRGAEVLGPILARIAGVVGGVLVRVFRTLGSVIAGVWRIAGPVLSVIGEAVWTLAVVAFQVGRRIHSAFSVLFSALAPIARPVLETVGGLFRILGGVMSAVASAVQGAWSAFFGWFASKVEFAANLARGLMSIARGFVGGGDPPAGGGPRRPPSAPGAAMVRGAQTQLRAADRAPTNAVTGSTVAAGRQVNRSTTVQVDKVEVNTQATDAKGIASAFATSLQSETRRAVQDTDDGVSH